CGERIRSTRRAHGRKTPRGTAQFDIVGCERLSTRGFAGAECGVAQQTTERMSMKLTRSVGYAVGILLRVDSAGSEEPMTAEAISKGCKFPPRFLYRVLRRMVDAGLLDGVSGPRGGYTLAKKPGQIKLLDIVEAVDEVENESGLVAVNRTHKPVIGYI